MLRKPFPCLRNTFHLTSNIIGIIEIELHVFKIIGTIEIEFWEFWKILSESSKLKSRNFESIIGIIKFQRIVPQINCNLNCYREGRIAIVGPSFNLLSKYYRNAYQSEWFFKKP